MVIFIYDPGVGRSYFSFKSSTGLPLKNNTIRQISLKNYNASLGRSVISSVTTDDDDDTVTGKMTANSAQCQPTRQPYAF
jgi:hypothetical protein